MNEFLDKLFQYEYFGTILFAVIAILIIAFFIILFFGKKEEKERILEETRKLELANLNAFKEEESFSKVEVQEETAPIITETNNIELNNFEEASLDTPLLTPIETEPLVDFKLENNNYVDSYELPDNNLASFNLLDEEDKNEEYQLPESSFKVNPSIPDYNFEEIANALSKELDELERLSKYNPFETKLEEKPEEPIQIELPKVSEEKEEKKFKPSPVFSSVFVPITDNKEIKEHTSLKEEKVIESVFTNEVKKVDFSELVKNEIKTHEEKPVEKEEMPTPVVTEKVNELDFSILKANNTEQTSKPKVDLPKQVDLPRKSI